MAIFGKSHRNHGSAKGGGRFGGGTRFAKGAKGGGSFGGGSRFAKVAKGAPKGAHGAKGGKAGKSHGGKGHGGKGGKADQGSLTWSRGTVMAARWQGGPRQGHGGQGWQGGPRQGARSWRQGGKAARVARVARVFVPAAVVPVRGGDRRSGNSKGHGGKGAAPFQGHGGKGHGGKGAAIKGHRGKGHSDKGHSGSARRFGRFTARHSGHRGKGHSDKGHSEGKGKGKPVNKRMDKLGKLGAEQKVWVGGLRMETSWKKLSDHLEEVFLKPSIVEIMSKGSACLAFKSAEEAESAIGALNGSDFEGQAIEVDVWTKKEKKERPEGAKPKKDKPVIKRSLKLKNGKKTADSPMTLKIKAVDHALKLWVGGLSTETKSKALKQHFVDNGCEVDMCDLLRKPGSACVTFKTEDEAAAAAGSLNGTDLEGETIQVDVWTRPERKEKKNKED